MQGPPGILGRVIAFDDPETFQYTRDNLLNQMMMGKIGANQFAAAMNELNRERLRIWFR